MKISYNWLKWYVPEIPEADKLTDVFMYHLCEVESVETLPDGDTLYDLNILPNRAHDLLCFHGVARELSGQLGIKFVDPTPYYKIPESKPTELEIKIETDKCRRYAGRIVRNIKVGPSPEWVVKHLASIGQRSINNIVDATNICMFDGGNPSHAFDLLKSGSKIRITTAQEGEKLELVGSDKIVATLKESDAVIMGAGTLALAGVKGGTISGISDSTTDILLEVANFDPVATRKTARRLGIFSDAAKRFENDLSPELVPFAMTELSALILEMCPEATFEEIVDVYPKPQEKRELAFTVSEINKKLGADISAAEVEDILKRYNYEFTRDGERIRLAVPPLRLDLTGEHDMTEEIGRIYGYEKIKPEIPKIDFIPKANEMHMRLLAAREKLLAEGYSEVMTYTFTKKGKIEVSRGAKGKEFLRTNLSDGLKDSYELNRLNAPLLGLSEVKIFEIGMVFLSADVQEMHIATATKKGVTESTLEEFTKEIQNANTELGSQIKSGKTQKNTKFAPWSLYPFIYRDIAIWVPKGVAAGDVALVLKSEAGELLVRDPQLFDQFEKEGRTSLAFRIVFQSSERTLVEEEISKIMEKVTNTLKAKGWEVR